MVRMAILAVLVLVLANWTQNDLPFANNAKTAENAVGGIADQNADKEMAIARDYLDKHNHLVAINRFKAVVSQFQTSRHVEEALAHITES
jgi:outer membrane protein assembly factor BamD